MNKYKIVSLILTLTISLPIYFYLFYKILKYVNASELMMFLFWIYIPVNVLIVIVSKIVED